MEEQGRVEVRRGEGRGKDRDKGGRQGFIKVLYNYKGQFCWRKLEIIIIKLFIC